MRRRGIKASVTVAAFNVLIYRRISYHILYYIIIRRVIVSVVVGRIRTERLYFARPRKNRR